MKRFVYLLLLIANISFGQTPQIIAHRGGAGMAPENTIAAFHKAIEANAHYFELDVQISSDDSLMIMHDGTVNRTTDGSGVVSAMTYLQLRELDAGSWFGADFSGEKIPTLRESLIVAKNSANNIGVVVEIKTSDASVPSKVVSLVQSLDMESMVIVSGFSLSQITLIKSLDATIPVQLFATISTTHIDQVAAINGEWVGSGGGITQEIIDYAHSLGISFNAWTINSTTQMLPLIALGVDAITTDYPSVLITAMDDTEPSDVVLSSATAFETDVILTWEAANDPESGISGYDIFRDETTSPTSLLTSLGAVTQYVDLTYNESQQYYYRIKAKNPAGLSSANYSNEISVTTLVDLTPPIIRYVTSKGENSTVVIEFSERVDKTTAEATLNYIFSYGVTVSEAKLGMDLKSVILTTSPLLEQSYLLTVENVSDRANTPNVMDSKTLIFFHKGIHEDQVAYYTLDTIAVEASDKFIIDATENINHGLAYNGIYQEEGILGNALGFDGVDDYVQFSSSTSFDINNNSVTVSLWTKLGYLPTELPDSYGPLFDSDGDQYVLYEDRGNSELRFKVATSNGAERPGISNTDLIAGEWIHIAGVYDGSNAMIYLNGEKKDSHALTGDVKTGQVASLGRNGSTYFKGSIDQVEILNVALSDEEILEMYENCRIKVLDCDSSDLHEDISICAGETYVFPDGTEGSETMVHISYLDAFYGCEGSITTNLTLFSPDVSVSQDDITLVANASDAVYQWLDCDNENTAISGGTDQSYTPTVTGNYAVEINLDGCVDTSECINFVLAGLEKAESTMFTIYPNPGNGEFTIDLNSTSQQVVKLEIFNLVGQHVFEEQLHDETTTLNLSQLPGGTYILRLRYENYTYTRKLIIQ